jgi:hypothetical protein
LNVGNTSFPIIIDDEDPRAKAWVRRKKGAAPQQPSEDIPTSDIKREHKLEREYQAEHAPIDEYRKSRFIPNAKWFCPDCRLNLNNKPRAECRSDRHMQYYAKRHPRYVPVSSNTVTSTPDRQPRGPRSA